MPDLKRIDLAIYYPKIEAGKNRQNSIISNSLAPIESGLAVVGSVRQKLVIFFENSLPAPFSSLMLGIVFGISSQMPKEFMDNLRVAGVMHVIAASGMNVAMVSEFIIVVLSAFLRRQTAMILSLIGIFFYAAISGFSPSILRASIMCSFVFSAQILGRQTLALFNLLATAYIMLMISPDLLTDIGFQLSFISTLGLVLIPKIKTLGVLGVIGEDINTTISAQIATLPILLANFGTYSVFSLAANALVLWTIPFLMIIGAISVFVGLIFQQAGHAILLLALPPLWYFKEVVTFFGKFSPIQLQTLSWQFTLGYYLLLSSFLIFSKRIVRN